MPAEFTYAPAVEEIAKQLIPAFFKELVEHRVHFKYVFSDQTIERNGKERWGECIKKGALDKLLLGDEIDDDSGFDPLTFVCVGCRRWRVESERNELQVGDEAMYFCETCYAEYSTWDLATNRTIALLQDKWETAKGKQLCGPPEHPGFFVIKMYSPVWLRLRQDQREYLVYHELCHAGVGWDANGDSKLFIVPHDIEEFNDCARRYGPSVKADIRRFLDEVAKHGQQELFTEQTVNG